MSSSTPKIALLIDADNLTVDVMEQAVTQLLAEHGALHIRRAYCTADSAHKNQANFKRLGIRPMVNLAAGKNSTDIALAVDAIDLVITERPDTVIIGSSDSDFTPLVARLREKGCRVQGIGQAGKTGDETQAAYDAFTVLAHRKKAGAPTRSSAAPAPRKAARKTARTTAHKTARAPVAVPTAAAEPSVSVSVPVPAQPPAPQPSPPPAAKAARPAARRSAVPAAPTAPTAPTAPAELRSILDVLPELEDGGSVSLQDASTRLRAAGLLSRHRSLAKLFTPHGEHFEVHAQSKQLRLRGRHDAD